MSKLNFLCLNNLEIFSSREIVFFEKVALEFSFKFNIDKFSKFSKKIIYIKVEDLVNNFLVAYVGEGKLIPSVKRTDVIFHTKRALQEFSYDTLKSIK